MASRKTLNTQPTKTRSIVHALLAWFNVHARDLPWRRTRVPYAIWVSEIMLQQTQVATVVPYWKRWMRALPTVQAVAKAHPTKLRKLWEGLGYYARVANLQRAARQIVKQHAGTFPRDFDAILALPGIGRYTAGAIASIAFNEPRPIVDGNVTRVLTRLFAIRKDPRERKTHVRLWQFAETLVNEASRTTPRGILASVAASRQSAAIPKSAGRKCSTRRKPLHGSEVARMTSGACSALNQSLMELGAVICTPRNPLCPACPVARLCLARRLGVAEWLPRLGKRSRPEPKLIIAFLVHRRGHVLTRQRPSGAINGRFWELPQMDFNGAHSQLAPQSRRSLAIEPLSTKPLCSVAHNITRYRIRVDVFAGKLLRRLPKARWFSPAELRKQPFTGLDRKILRRLLAS